MGAIVSGVTTEGYRYIDNELTWAPTALVSYTVDSTFEAVLSLNDSNNSQFGPGIYLDYDTVSFANSLPEPYFSKQTPWSAPWKKNFAGGSTAPELIQANQTYTIRFASEQPGQAAQDNAELLITHSKAECWLPVGCTSGAYCYIHDSLFSLEPIPGRIDWQPVSRRCGEWVAWFLPYIRGQ